MTEEITPYQTLRTGPIEKTELAEWFETFIDEKMFQNSFKGDPLKRDIHSLIARLDEERKERHNAFLRWYHDPTEENAIEFFKEQADERLFSLFIFAKVAGYTSLIRK